ncbi:MAG: diguanylate cyclase with sensor [Firmicutes bacterium]|nr:diguanylate cyclase with sensor [Bacillota bacterium]
MLTRLSLKTKITALVVAIVGLASGFLGQFVVSTLSNLLNDAAGRGTATAAAAIAVSIDPSVLSSDQAVPSLGKIQAQFQEMVDQGSLAGVSIMRVDHQANRVVYIASAGKDYVSENYAPGTSFGLDDPRSTLLHWKQKAGRAVWDFDKAPDRVFIAGWAPIMQGSEQVGLALLFADVTPINNALNTLAIAVIATCVILVLLSGFIAYKLATGFEKTAVTDGLMGIYNHKYFKQRLEEETAKSRRYKQQTALVLLDIDFFKRVNDTYGHATGDIVLKNLAKWVTEGMRNTDVVARYGGEEIAIILPHTSLAGAQEFAERLRIKISHQVVRDPEEKAEFRVTVSVGVAQWEPGMTSMDMIKRADTALYHSKHMGRNRVTIYQDEILPPPESQTAAKD